MSTFVSATGWDRLLPWYDPLVAALTRESRFKTHLLDQANLSAGLRLLDLGCGSGTLIASAVSREPNLKVVGLDADSRILKQARSKLMDRPAVALIQGDATSLPHDANSFDVVTSSLVFHHLLPNEKRQSLTEIYRVLTPGGRLLLADYGRPANFLCRIAFWFVRMIDGFSRTRCNVQGRLPELITGAGMQNVEETLTLNTPLGTLRCYVACKPNRG